MSADAMRLGVLLTIAVIAAGLPSSADAGWRQPVGGPSPINQSDAREGSQLSLAAIGGVPHIAWREHDGMNYEIRVARFNGTANRWEQPWTDVDDGHGGINQSVLQLAELPSLADVGGVPYVAWSEADGTNYEVRVARLDPATNRWEQPWTGVSDTYGGINQSTAGFAGELSLAAIGGIPHVAWTEGDVTGSPFNKELRVAVLNGNTWTQPWAGVTASYGGINQSTDKDAFEPSLADVGGNPYVAWSETDGSAFGNREVRVAGLFGNAWRQPWTGVSDSSGAINESTIQGANGPSLVAFGGVPHVAWSESDSTNSELRVARLDDGTLAWRQPWAGVGSTAGGIDHDSHTGTAFQPSLAPIGDRPHVAWLEYDGTNEELRVARLKANAWGEPWTGVTDTSGTINQSTLRSAEQPSLASIGGIPYVAWHESDASNAEARVSRLEPEFTSQTVVPSTTEATLTAGIRTYGLPYPVGFRHGAALESEVAPVPATVGADEVTVSRRVAGLAPAITLAFQPFATAGVAAPRVLGPVGSFSTFPEPDTRAPAVRRFAFAPRRFRVGARRTAPTARAPRRGSHVRFALSEPATVRIAIDRFRRGRNGRRAGALTRRQLAAGRHSLHFSGRLGARALAAGRYRATLTATDAAGNRSKPRRATFTVVRR